MLRKAINVVHELASIRINKSFHCGRLNSDRLIWFEHLSPQSLSTTMVFQPGSTIQPSPLIQLLTCYGKRQRLTIRDML
jgi:hypothetical protein